MTWQTFVDAAGWMARVSVSVVVGFLMAPLAAQAVAAAITAQWPVMDHWVVDSVRVEGADVVVSGSMHKRWDWDYVAPPRAHDEATDQPLSVVSLAPAPITPWPPGERRAFGPWVVKDGAARTRITFQQHHRLFGFINSYSELGTIDTRKAR